MKSINNISTIADLFISLAEDTNYALTEKEKQYHREYKQMIRDLAKTNPEDPRVQKYIERKKYEQIVHKERMLSDPEYAKQQKEKGRLRARNYQQRLSIEEAEEQEKKDKEHRAIDTLRKRELINSQTLEGYVLKLGIQIASTKNEFKKYISATQDEEKKILAIQKQQEFESKIPSLYQFRDATKQIATNKTTQTITANMIAYTANMGKNLFTEMKSLNFNTIARTLRLIVLELHNMADMFTER